MDPAGKETAGFFRGLMGRSLRSAESDTIEAVSYTHLTLPTKA